MESKVKNTCAVCKKDIPESDYYCSNDCKEKDRRPTNWYDNIIDFLFGWL